ncbi:MAG: cell division protein SepF [Thermococcus sp.]|uniref:cell division protein SepF n=1 Tax=Thermococcus sp. TaxID=35749 RepID=UPI001D6B680C|nr:cell division protein SepF [Thermococcus sp.]MBO8174788.1 cell division protein SepF [Thermococcus sp.]
MGLFDKIIKKEEPKRKPLKSIRKEVEGTPRVDIDVIPLEEDELAKELIKPEIRYIKKIVVTSYTDLEKISEEIQEGNIVIVDLTPLESKTDVLEKVAEQIKGMVHALGGDVAKISKYEIKLIVTPPDIKIYKG